MKTIESLYIHFPFCKHLCNYCDFYKKVLDNRSTNLSGFHDYFTSAFLVHESLMDEFGYSWAPLKTLYIGGGTPSLWGIEGKEFLQNLFLKKGLKLAPDCEFTLEVNPGAWTEESLGAWRELGVNRYSLGIQTLAPNLVEYLDRVHSIEDVYQTLEHFHKEGANFSVDFMLGLPFSKENKRDVIQELKNALRYNPQHFSVYILTVKENYKYYKHLPSEEWIEDEYLRVADFLKSQGYYHYEVSNFSLTNKSSKHNLSYWKSQTVAAIGPSATGFLAEEKVRYKWKVNSAEIDRELLSDSEFLLEKIYMGLRSSIGVSLDTFSDSQGALSLMLENWTKQGLATIDDDKIITLTSRGFLILDSLMNDLFAQNLIK